jgi:hypothetical protein
VTAYVEFEQCAHGAGDLLHAGIAKFENLFAMIANEVIVLFVAVGLFVV